VGKLRHPHGVRGEMLMEVYTDFPERLVPGVILYLGTEAQPLKLIKSRPHREGLLVTFEGFTTPEEVGLFRNQVLYVHADDRPQLEQGEYYHHQLIGLRAVTPAGELVGRMVEILATGASDVLVVRPDAGADILIPIVDEFVPRIDLERGEITVTLIPGMRGEES
jgi:16S rRNA processing protein RimM